MDWHTATGVWKMKQQKKSREERGLKIKKIHCTRFRLHLTKGSLPFM